MNLKDITNNELVTRINTLKTKENHVISDLVLHIHEIDKRGYYRDLSYSSLFSYLTEGLKYSEGAAQRRIRAARAINDNPDIFQKLRDGTLTLCTVCEISKVTPKDRTDLIKLSENKSKREVEKLVSQTLFPLMPAVKAKKESVRVSKVIVPAMPLLNRSEAVASESYTVTLQVDIEFMELLEEAKLLTGVPRNSQVLLKALKGFVKKKTPKAPKKVTATSNMKVNKVSRYIPVSVKNQILTKDRCQCSYVSSNGKRCTAKSHLEIDHIKPYATGGGNKIDNLRVLCMSHNQMFAERYFGKSKISQFRKIYLGNH